MNMNLPPARPTHLILDLGGVLVRLNSVAWLWSEADQSETMTGSEQIWQTSTTVKAYETGQIKDLETFYRAARADGNHSGQSDFFARFPGLIGELFAETIPVLTRLQAAYTLYLLSNIGERIGFIAAINWGWALFSTDLLVVRNGCFKAGPTNFSADAAKHQSASIQHLLF